jgi:hypothetical protein
MAITDITKEHLIERYVRPARQRGDKTIQVRVGSVLKELGWSNRTPSVFSTLGSRAFQEEAGVELIEKRGGPPSGGPSTTWQFVYRVLDREPVPGAEPQKKIQNGAGLMNLAGICSDAFRLLGRGEAFLKREREWGPDTWERYAEEQGKSRPGNPK